MGENLHIISALVANKSGVLNRVSGLFSKRGYNIESLSVAFTEDRNYSRMTIVVNGDDYVLEQITKQLAKLVDVKYVMQLNPDRSVHRELLLVKIKATPQQRAEIESTIRLYKAKAVDLSPNSMIIELTGESNKIDGFLQVIGEYGIIEMARTGLTALHRGSQSIKELGEYEGE
ncbi:MAG TPA: acetolactate synthase small subunit [Clostridia bacterium]|jgi:acetolactate synthase-1/3 small subunit